MLSQYELIGKSKNGVDVVYDPAHSHAATHLEDTAQLKGLVIEVVGDIELNGQVVRAYFDMGRIVGTCDVVEVDDTDEIVYGMRKNRMDDGLVPFVKTREPAPCPYVTVHLVPRANGSYELLSTWIGTVGDDDEPFPQSPDATPRSVDFWSKRAFVYGSQEIIEGTETPNKPW